MCGRFAVTTDPALLAAKIEAIDETETSRDDDGKSTGGANYNVAPTTMVSSVVKRHAQPDHSPSLRSPREDESTRRVRSMRWGLIPPWVKTTADGKPDTSGPLLINARAETLTTSPAFRGSAKSKRCLIPMDGWYEWQPSATDKKAKTPFYMHAQDGELLFMAGLWTTWRPSGASEAPGEVAGAPRDSAPLVSCTIITTESVGPLAQIHDRMPLTISAPDWDRWLDPDAPIDEGLLRGHGDLDRIVTREVSRLVNNIRNNGPELIEPAEPEATLF